MDQKSISGFRWILQAVLLLFSLLLIISDTTDMPYLTLCYLTVADIILCSFLFVLRRSAQLTNAKFLFWIITTVFSFGQNIAYIFIKNNTYLYSDQLYVRTYSLDSVIEGTIFTILAFNFFSIGLASGSKRKECEIVEKLEKNTDQYASSAILVGQLLFLISVVPEIMCLYAEINLFFASGYGENAISGLPSTIQVLHYWFIPSILICYVGKAASGKKTLLETAILLCISLAFMLIGDRGFSLAVLLVLIWLRSIFYRVKKKKLYIWCLLLILLIPFVKFFRIAFSAGTGDAIGTAFSQMIEANPFIDMLLELGSSQEIIIKTMKKVSIEGFAYGTAYLDFFIKMLPGFLEIPLFYGNLAKWVIGTSNYQTQGFSIWGEAYLNFGMWGIPFMFLVGKFFGLLLDAKKNDSLLKIILTSVSLYFFADVSRRAVSGFGYNFLYNIVLPIVAIYVLDFLNKDKGKRTIWMK